MDARTGKAELEAKPAKYVGDRITSATDKLIGSRGCGILPYIDPSGIWHPGQSSTAALITGVFR